MTIKLEFGQKLVYQTDESGFYVGETAADPDPLTEGHWLIPAGAVELKPPAITGGWRAQWMGYKWRLVTAQ